MTPLAEINPYVGLRPFEAQDSLYFFGRRSQVGELLDRLHEHSFLAVVGSSGCGKSSLIRAGLIPALLGGFLVQERDRWSVAVMKPGDAPLWNLAASMVAGSGDADAPDARERTAALHSALLSDHDEAVENFIRENLPPTANLLLLVDQFEELFEFRSRGAIEGATLTAPARREQSKRRADASDFVELLLRVARDEAVPVYCVITMRSDFLGDCDVFYGLPEALNRGRYLVPRLTREQLRTAIEGPALVAGATVAPRLLDTVLNDLGDRSDHLPVLQHAMLRTWDEWKRLHDDGPLDLRHYEQAGGLEKALSKHANEALTPDNTDTVAKIFKRLTDTDANQRRIRRPSTLDDLVAVTGASRERVLQIINEFRAGGRNFLVLSQQEDHANPRIDLSHESLIRQWNRLKVWVDQESKKRETYLSLVKKARDEKVGAEALLTEPALSIASEWRQVEKPTAAWARRYTPDEQEFALVESYIDRSRYAAHAAAQRTRHLRIGVGILAIATILVLLGLSWFGFQQSNLAEANLARAEVNLARVLEEKAASAVREDQPAKAWTYNLAALDALPEGADPAMLPVSMGRLLDSSICPGANCAPDPSVVNLNPAGAGPEPAETWMPRAVWQDAGGRLFAAAVRGCPPGQPCRAEFAVHAMFRGSVSGAVRVDRLDSATIEQRTATPRRADSSGEPLEPQTVRIETLAASTDGATIALGLSDGAVELWGLESGQGRTQLKRVNEQNAPANEVRRVTSLAFSPGPAARQLAAAFDDGDVYVWQRGGDSAPVVKPSPDPELPTLALAFSPNGQRLALGNAAGITVWNLDGQMEPLPVVLHDPSEHPAVDPILSLAYSPAGTCLAAGRPAGRISVYCFVEGDPRAYEVLEFVSGGSNVDGLSFDDEGNYLFTAGGDGSVRRTPLVLYLYEEQTWNLLDFFAHPDSRAQRAEIRQQYETALAKFGLQPDENLDLVETGAVERIVVRARYYPARGAAAALQPINDSGTFIWQNRVCQFRQVSLNGQGNTVRVQPRSSVSLSFGWETGVRPAKEFYCPSCIVQFYVGIRDRFSACLVSDVMPPSYFRGRSGKFSRTFQAPAEPGVYYVTFGQSLQYECKENPATQPANAAQAVAALIVE